MSWGLSEAKTERRLLGMVLAYFVIVGRKSIADGFTNAQALLIRFLT